MEKVIFKIPDLKNAVRIISPVIAPRSIISATEYAKFVISSGAAWVEGSDLENCIRTQISCEATESFSFLFPFEDLKKLSAISSDGDFEITHIVDGKTRSLEIATPTGKAKRQTIDVLDFPKLPEGRAAATANLDATGIGKLKTSISFALLNQNKPQFHGVYLTIKNANLNIVASDLNIFYMSGNLQTTCDKNTKAFLSVKSAKVVACILSDSAIIDFIEDGHVRFISGNSEIYCRLLDQDYIQYDGLIPNYDKSFTVDKSDLFSSINFASLSASSITKQIRFSLKEDSLFLTSSDDYISKTGTSEPIRVLDNSCEDFDFSFNGEKLAIAISHLSDKVVFRTSGNPENMFLLSDLTTTDTTLIAPLFILQTN